MAQSLNTPDVLTQPIANNGTKNSIPATNDQSLGLMSQSTGFPPICSERIADGGKAPRRADFNGAFNLLSQQHFFFQNGGTETFRQEVSDAIGGYPLNARLWYLNENGETYVLRSTKANNTDNFLTNPSVIGDSWVYDVSTTSYVNAKINEIRTNCITEIPQDIKLELKNGTLTLKAGSKVYVPNGKNANGSLKFDEVILRNDQVFSTGFKGPQVALFYGGHLRMSLDRIFSGNTMPSTTNNDNIWYDTANNKIKTYKTASSSWIEFDVCSLPIGLATANADGTGFVSIDQVFNGFGYIGSTVFALPGVKGLIPDGRNADGSLKNLEFETTKVKVSENTGSGRDIFVIDKYYNINRVPSSAYKFDIDNNKWVRTDGGSDRFHCVCGSTTGDITSFTSKVAFRAVDYNDAVLKYGDQDIGGNKNFTGTLKALTPSSATDNSTNVATTAWTNNFITNKKPEIVGWGIPDYSAGISISSGYVAEANGMVKIVRGVGGGAVSLYVDGVVVDGNYSNTSNEGGVLKADVKKGSTVTWDTGNITDTPTFYPCIGG